MANQRTSSPSSENKEHTETLDVITVKEKIIERSLQDTIESIAVSIARISLLLNLITLNIFIRFS